MTIEVNEWLKTVIDWKNAKQIFGTKDGKRSLKKADRVVLSGDLVIENLNDLEDLNLHDVRELNKIVIKNCPKLKNINLLNSGIKQLEVGPGLDQIEELSIGFEIDSTDRPTPRKLDKVDLSNITNLISFKCVGVQETELIGFEKLTQLESFLGSKGVKIPTNKVKKADLDNANAKINNLINIVEKQNHAIEEFGDKLDDYKPEFRVKWKAAIVDVSKFKI